MALIPRPPHTGNIELDSVLTYLVDRVNDGVVQPGINAGAAAAPAQPGQDGRVGNSTIYLYSRTPDETAPARPNNVSYDFTNINTPVTVNDMDSPWSPNIPEAGGGFLWVTFRYVAGESGTITDPSSWNLPSLLGRPGEDGEDGARRANGFIYIARMAPGDPPPTTTDATSFDWVEGTFTDTGIPAGWSLTAPSSTTMGQRIYVSRWTASENEGLINTTLTYDAVVEAQVVLNDVKSPNYDGSTGADAADNPGTQGYLLDSENGTIIANDIMIRGMDTNGPNVLVGRDSSAGAGVIEGVAVGNNAAVTGNNAIAIGDGISSGANSINVGDSTHTGAVMVGPYNLANFSTGGGVGDTGRDACFDFGRRINPDRHFTFGRRVT